MRGRNLPRFLFEVAAGVTGFLAPGAGWPPTSFLANRYSGDYAGYPQPLEDAMGMRLSALLLQLYAAYTAMNRIRPAT